MRRNVIGRSVQSERPLEAVVLIIAFGSFMNRARLSRPRRT